MEEALASPFLPDLPSSHVFVTRIIAELSKFRPPTIDEGDARSHTHTFVRNQQQQEQGKGNVFARLPASQLSALKPLMLTLHCLLPNELLPALDILDRKLVGRYYLVTERDADANTDTDSTEQKRKLNDDNNTNSNNNEWPGEEHYFVRSTTTTALDKAYEVRLRAWNCTCPAFTLSVFRDPEPAAIDVSSILSMAAQDELDEDCWFGGTLARARSKTSSPPVCCKHLLACVLASRCPALFEDGVEEKHGISVEELAGWYAGWGG
jgi:hypothetical protein